MVTTYRKHASRDHMVAFSMADIRFVVGIIAHMARTSGPDFGITVRNVIKAKTNKERVAALTTPFATDPYVLRHISLSIDGDYNFFTPDTFMPRDFDLWMRCSTELGHRGESLPPLFDRWFQGSALNAQPARYGQCPFGNWDEFRLLEPHLLSSDRYPEQVDMMESLIDEFMAPRLGKKMEIGQMMRLLLWNLHCATSYGEGPSEETAKMLTIFDDHLPEFDYATRMSGSGIAYTWPDSLSAQVYTIGDWCWRIALNRARNLKDFENHKDVLTNMLREYPDMDLAKMEGALRGVFTGGMNNCHSAVCGTLISNIRGDDFIHDYLQREPTENIEHVLREALRLFTAIPTARHVRDQDDFVLNDGTRLQPGTFVILSTYCVNTDPRWWTNPLEFDASRFQDTTELGVLCQRGFVPVGAASELGGRACGARFHVAHILRVILRRLLTEYQFTEVGNGRGFEMKQSAGTSMYAGECNVVVARRSLPN